MKKFKIVALYHVTYAFIAEDIEQAIAALKREPFSFVESEKHLKDCGVHAYEVNDFYELEPINLIE